MPLDATHILLGTLGKKEPLLAHTAPASIEENVRSSL